MSGTSLSRRDLLGCLGAALLAPRLSAQGLSLHGPVAGISALLGPLAARVGGQPVLWRNIDELRAGLAAGRIQATLLPTYVAAALAGKGVDLALASVVTRGTLTLLAPSPVADVRGLAGRRVGLFLRQDLPDLVMTVLARRAGMDPEKDFQRIYTAGAPEAVGLLLAGKLDAAILAEPLATLALTKAQAAGRTLVRALDVEEAWGRATGQTGGLPQIGLAVSGGLKDRIPALQAGLGEVITLARKDPARFVSQAPQGLGVEPALLQAALPRLRLEHRTAREARTDLEAFFRLLLEAHPRLMPRLPDAGFYR